MNYSVDELEVIRELCTRLTRTCGVTNKNDGNLHVRFHNSEVHLVVASIETPAMLENRMAANLEQEKRMAALSKRVWQHGIDLDLELTYVEEGEYPK